MKIKLPNNLKIYIACGKTDIRKSIDGLSALVSQNFNLKPFDPAIFLFGGRKRDRMKALLWEGDGFLLPYKRLENSSFTSEERQIKGLEKEKPLLDAFWSWVKQQIKHGKGSTIWSKP